MSFSSPSVCQSSVQRTDVAIKDDKYPITNNILEVPIESQIEEIVIIEDEDLIEVLSWASHLGSSWQFRSILRSSSIFILVYISLMELF